MNNLENLLMSGDPAFAATQKLLFRLAKTKIPADCLQWLKQTKDLDLSSFPEWKGPPLTISFLSELTQLTSLNLSYQTFIEEDFSSYISSSVKELSLNGIRFSKNLNLSNQNNLEKLSLDEAILLGEVPLIQALAPIATHLVSLSARKTKLKSLEGIENFSKIEELNLPDNDLFRLTPIASLKNLKVLNLSKNIIEDLSPLKGLKSLKRLNLSENKIDNLEDLADARALTVLDLSRNKIRKVSPLRDLRDLYELNLAGNPLTEDDLEIFPRSLRVKI